MVFLYHYYGKNSGTPHRNFVEKNHRKKSPVQRPEVAHQDHELGETEETTPGRYPGWMVNL
jgi:hypothetical protein